MKCEICGIEKGRYLKGHVEKEHGLSSQEYYDLYEKQNQEEGICETCKKPTTFQNIYKGYSRYCSNKCLANSKAVKQKRANTNLEKYGGETPFHSKEIQEKVKQTNLKKYGVVNPLANPEIRKKIKQTNIEKYGVENTLASPEIRRKGKETMLEKYGVDNGSKSKEIQEKIKQTNLKKYGVEYVTQSSQVQEKMKQTNLEKYGAENVFGSKEIQEKIKQHNLEVYGVEYIGASEEVQEKIKQTNLEKYGVENVLSAPEIQNKIKRTMTKKYGVDHNFKSVEIQEKIKQTNLEKYGFEYASSSPHIKAAKIKTSMSNHGVPHYFLSNDFKEKAKKTNLEKYGTETPQSSEVVKNRTIKTNLEKYGVEHTFQLEEVKEKAKKTNLKKYGSAYAIQSDIIQKKLQETLKKKKQEMLKQGFTPVARLIEKYGASWTFYDVFKKEIFLESGCRYIKSDYIPKIQEYFEQNRFRSNFEREVFDFISSIYKDDIITNDRTLIPPLEIDIFIPKNKVAIECDGTYWHSTNYGLSPEYHVNKTEACLQQGIRLIHISEWEWYNKRDVVKSIISSSLGIYSEVFYARKCDVRPISHDLSKSFLEENHLQGNANASIRLGLFNKDQLVQVVTLGKPRFSNEKGHELIRMASKIGVKIIGGFSKLLSHLPTEVTDVISYVDRSKFTGEGYFATGWYFTDVVSPGYSYYKGDRKVSRFQAQKHRLPILLGDEFDIQKTEKENMLANKFLQIFDCGNLKFKKSLLEIKG